MPRIYDSTSNPLDFCQRCWVKDEKRAYERYSGPDKEGPDGRGDCWCYEADHPPYEYDDYRCHKCNRTLTEKDN